MGPEGPLGGKQGVDLVMPWAQALELTAEGCTGSWNLMAADEFAGEAGVQQRIPVLLFGAWLHSHCHLQALRS